MPNILINLAETQEHTYARYSYVLCSVMQCVNETHLHEVCQAVLIDRRVVCTASRRSCHGELHGSTDELH